MKTLIFDLDGTLVSLQPKLVLYADLAYLRELRRRYDFALVSGSPRAEIFDALERTGLRQFFDAANIVSFEDTMSQKASGKPFLVARQRLSGSVVMIGDSGSDEEGSRVAGLPFVRVVKGGSVLDQRRMFALSCEAATKLLESA